jgi:hypothetical protein
MKPDDLIASYVDDVARRLPRKLRADVGAELRALLGEELQGHAETAGRPADAAMALALLTSFGLPADVADRYRPASFVIIRSAETPAFALTALGGVALQWALTLPAVFLAPQHYAGQAFARLGAWWVSFGLAAFWWPGLMVVGALLLRWTQHRWPRVETWEPPRLVDRDRVNRPLLALGLVAWALGAAIWIGMPWYGPHLPGALPRVFAFDATFLATRASWLLPVWAGHYAVHVMAMIEGRWRRLTRRLSLGLSLALAALLAWFIVGGPVFVSRPTDDAAKGLTALVVLLTLLAEAVNLHRELTRIGPARSSSLTPPLKGAAPR